ncbi:MAG TPA: SLC13 family permease [Blastocatellia bacterium]|nr:SLC13 family permease [Blastocatellia bacterium]
MHITIQQISFFVILLVAFGLLITERLRNDIVGVLIILALAVTRVLSPAEALSGFASEPAIVVASIFIISGAFHQTGLAELMGSAIGRLAGQGYSRVLVVIMLCVAVLSAFTHHVTTTAVMLPVVLTLSRERHLPASKLLMPLSFAASLGTTITIIGAPAFLVCSDVLQRAGRPALGIFSITPIGLTLSVAGTVFMVLIGRFLLPSNEAGEDPANVYRLENYFTEIKILPDSQFIDKTLAEVKGNHYNFTTVGWIRSGRRMRGLISGGRLAAGDVLLVQTTPEDMMAFRQEQGIELHPVEKYGADEKGSNQDDEDDIAEKLAQAVIAPTSEIIGRTIGDIDFRRRYGAIVVGLWRQDGFLQQELARIKLKAGDVLVLQGDEASLSRIANDPAFLIMVPFHGELRLRRKARTAGLLMLATIGAAATNVTTLEIVMLAGAVAMVLSGCLTPRQAYRAVDTKIYVFIAGAIPLGAAMQKTGTATLLAGGLQHIVGGWSSIATLLLIFAIVAVVTQFMSDAATTALFAPVAIALALALGRAPEPYVITVGMAAVVSFLTPIGHHGNLLVYGPGRYTFVDFLRVGAPLTVVIAILVVVMAQMLWPS